MTLVVRPLIVHLLEPQSLKCEQCNPLRRAPSTHLVSDTPVRHIRGMVSRLRASGSRCCSLHCSSRKNVLSRTLITTSGGTSRISSFRTTVITSLLLCFHKKVT